MSKRIGGVIGCKDKTSSWHLNGFPIGSNIEVGQQYVVGEKSALNRSSISSRVVCVFTRHKYTFSRSSFFSKFGLLRVTFQPKLSLLIGSSQTRLQIRRPSEMR